MKNISLIKIMILAFALLGVVIVIAAISSMEGEDSADTVKSADEQGIYNLLLLGKDAEAGLSDVMMLISFNVSDGNVNVMQIPRDTYFNFTDKSYKKINGAPRELGTAGFSTSLGESLGINIDYYLSLSLDVVRNMVDALGGVTLYVPKNMDYDDPEQNLHIHIKSGEQTLDGASAVQFLRYRSGYVTGDIGRIDAQKLFMSAFIKKLGENKKPATFYKLFKLLVNNGETNITEQDVIRVMTELTRVEGGAVYYLTAPGEALQSDKSGAWYYILSKPSICEVLNARFGADSDKNVFDKDNKFVDKRVKSFYDIYEKRCEYKVYSAEDIDNNLIDIN